MHSPLQRLLTMGVAKDSPSLDVHIRSGSASYRDSSQDFRVRHVPCTTHDSSPVTSTGWQDHLDICSLPRAGRVPAEPFVPRPTGRYSCLSHFTEEEIQGVTLTLRTPCSWPARVPVGPPVLCVWVGGGMCGPRTLVKTPAPGMGPPRVCCEGLDWLSCSLLNSCSRTEGRS